ncbi:hypothetical protein PTKIN_Ptkin16aG0102300 [Pterospermum kingtungense]
MALSFGFCLNLLAKPGASSFPSVSSSPFAVSHSSVVSTLSAKKNLKHPRGFTRASAEGLPSELVEDSKFVPLNADDPTFGAPALLLLGFEVEEAEKIRQFLKEMDGEFLEIIYCTEDMIPRSLWDAVNTKQTNLEEVKIAKSLPRICFFSGLSGEEMMMFIDAFPETGLEPAIFAALVPNSADKPVAELIEEIMGDHEMLVSWCFLAACLLKCLSDRLSSGDCGFTYVFEFLADWTTVRLNITCIVGLNRGRLPKRAVAHNDGRIQTKATLDSVP